MRLEAETLERKIDRATRHAESTGNFEAVDRLEDELDQVRYAMANARMKGANAADTGLKRCRDILA